MNRPICGWYRKVQKLPTTAGDSIIGIRMTVVQKPCPRNFLSISQASAKPRRVCIMIVQNTKCAVACIAAQMSGSVRISV